MTRISVDVNDEWLDAARAELGTSSKVDTINAALREIAMRRKGREIAEIFASAPIDFSGSADAWRYGGGRNLDDLIGHAQQEAGQG
ncbi:DUF2191 domain-containing protein [Kribbella catacumbae]|uniref:DUF2191 domain-containing protein n=1 Tax=Kribbella catacumbae TaxID=460086 RepID=UPI00047602FF|nr:DUF2191 domain-containing protein [Kribbella catacumbae]